MHLAGGISKENLGNLQKVTWVRACRTDKGVHAAINVVSLKMILEPPGIVERLNSNLPPSIRVFRVCRTSAAFHAKNAVDYRRYEYILPTYAFSPILSGVNFVFDDEMFNRINSLLQLFEGTHVFHNYTIGQTFADNSSKRYMRSIKCSKPFDLFGVPYVRITLEGQSFMLHQIRKMIGVLCLLIRFSGPDKIIPLTFTNTVINTPLAPAEFLTLDLAYFPSYNTKLQQLKSTLEPLDLESIKEKDEFKEKHIYPVICEDEKREYLVKKFLYRLDQWKPVVDNKTWDIYEWMKVVTKMEIVEPKIQFTRSEKKKQGRENWQKKKNRENDKKEDQQQIKEDNVQSGAQEKSEEV